MVYETDFRIVLQLSEWARLQCYKDSLTIVKDLDLSYELLKILPDIGYQAGDLPI
jgi:hypothetical protein